MLFRDLSKTTTIISCNNNKVLFHISEKNSFWLQKYEFFIVIWKKKLRRWLDNLTNSIVKYIDIVL